MDVLAPPLDEGFHQLGLAHMQLSVCSYYPSNPLPAMPATCHDEVHASRMQATVGGLLQFCEPASQYSLSKFTFLCLSYHILSYPILCFGQDNAGSRPRGHGRHARAPARGPHSWWLGRADDDMGR